MHDRSALGPADVTDGRLAVMVADLWGTDPDETELIESGVELVDYDLPAITTAGRYWVRGRARADGREQAFRLFVKHVQSWSRHPFFEDVPPEHRAAAAASVPWRTEALAYRSDLRERLPEGLSMPRAVGVFDIDEESNAVWLEAVPVVPAEWDLGRYARAGHLLGRLAASPRVAELRDVGQHEWDVRVYLEGRLLMQVLPMLRDERIWQHPLVAGAFDGDLRARLVDAADRAVGLVDELAAMPETTGHGDACPNNLLARADAGSFVLIDYGFWGPKPIGFDLGQLLVGDVQVGKRSADDLAEVEEVALGAYVEGLRAEGCDVPVDVVRRAHALQLLMFTGLSTLPFEFLDSTPTQELHEIAAERARIARFSLDLLDATG
jgi:hypothetical protein